MRGSLAFLLAGAQLFACSRAGPPAATRLTHELPAALQVPPPPPDETVLLLAEVPRAPRIVIPFRPRARWPFLLRMKLRRDGGKLPEVALRALTAAEAAALGDAPRPFTGAAPGADLGSCFPGAETGEWVSCQRFATLQQPGGAVAILISGEGVRDVEAHAAEVSPPLSPQSPLLHPLLTQVPRLMGRSSSFRDALVASGGETTYAFPVTLPAGGELRVGLGLESRTEPARFIARLDDQTLFDEVLDQEGWRDLSVPLPDAPGRVARLTLTARPTAGEVTHALWANPRIVGAVKKPSIVLLSIDALRPDHLGLYGYNRDTSPTLDKLAQAGVVFERATAQAPRTWQSVMSFLSGRYPTRAGVRTQGAPLPPEVPLLPELLAPFGYESVAGSDLAGFPPAMIDRFDEERLTVTLPGQTPGLSVPEQLDQVAKEIARRPTFAWFHLENVHYPLYPKEPLRYDPGYQGRFQSSFTTEDRLAFPRSAQLTGAELTHLRALYDAAIRDADALVLHLVQALIASGASESTILVITADHGDLVDEHGITIEHQTHFEGVLRVPLIVVWPKELTARRIAQRVQLVDLVPTLFALAGLPRPPGLDGRDLSPLLRGGTLPEADAFSEVSEVSRVVYRGDHKLIASAPGARIVLSGLEVPLPAQALYDVASDPAEAHPLDVPLAAELRAVLDAEITRERADQPREGVPVIGQAAQQALLRAGYLAKPAKP